MWLCAICQPWWNHFHYDYVEIEGEHIASRSNTGDMPVIRACAGLAHSRERGQSPPRRVLDEQRWPVNFERASGLQAPLDLAMWQQTRTTTRLELEAAETVHRRCKRELDLRDGLRARLK